jgi:hypothetical protein
MPKHTSTHKSFRDMALAIAAIDREKAAALRRSRPLAKRQTKTTPGPRIAR